MELKRPILILLLLLSAATVNPCSFSEDPLFFLMKRPDAPIAGYESGRLGVLLPSYARSHLVVAWRYLNGRPLSAAEQKEVLALMTHRLGEGDSNAIDAVHTWLNARNAIVTPPMKEIDPYGNAGNFGSFLNCTDDAFLTAAATLKARAATYGPTHAAVHGWVTAQDAVFDNCSGSREKPQPAEASLPSLIRADRAYQIAAAEFYAESFARAHELFTAIANNATSPWSHTARLVAARSLLRNATINAPSGNFFDDDLAADAEKELQAIAGNPAMRDIHAAAGQLLDYIHLRTDAEETLGRIAKEIDHGAITKQRLDDFTLILEDGQVIDEMTDWIATFKRAAEEQSYLETDLRPNAEAYAHARDRWREKQSAAWLVAALENAQPSSPDVHELLDASSKIDAKSPAFLTVAYHRARLIGEHAHDDLDRALAAKDIPASAHNLLLAMRTPLARSLDEFVRDAVRLPAGVAEDGTEKSESPLEWPPMFDEESAAMINRMLPLQSLIDASRIKDLPKQSRAQFLCAAFTRALLLRKYDVAAKLAPDVGAARPDLATLMQTYAAAPPSDRAYAALDVLVHAPGLSPYVDPRSGRANDTLDMTDSAHMHMNWWCEHAGSYGENHFPQYSHVPQLHVPAFAESLKDDVASEQKQLIANGAGPTYLMRAIMAWAKEKPNDARVPEALSLAIKGTRWACPDGSTGAIANQAFNFLHKHYASTTWAKETRYWYNGRY